MLDLIADQPQPVELFGGVFFGGGVVVLEDPTLEVAVYLGGVVGQLVVHAGDAAQEADQSHEGAGRLVAVHFFELGVGFPNVVRSQWQRSAFCAPRSRRARRGGR